MAAQKVSSIREHVSDRIGETRFNTWFGSTVEFDLEPDRLSVMVPNAFVGNWIATNYLSELKAAARAVAGETATVDVRVNSGNASVESVPQARDDRQRGAARPQPVVRREPRRRPETPRLRGELDSFVVGASNQLAYSAAHSAVLTPRGAFRPLFIHGGCGLGKTHLLHGICNGIATNHPTLRSCYISGEEFTNEFIHAVQARHIDAFRARYRRVDLLLIDDIHFLANKKATQEEFLHTFNAIDGYGNLVVLSSDRHPRNIAALSEPLRNRLIAGMVVEIKPPDYAVRREILRRRSVNMSCTIPEDVIDLIARRVTRNVRELEGALYKLAALASLTKEPITATMVEIALEDYLAPDGTQPGVDDIARVVGDYFAVPRERIDSSSRDRTVTLARAITMYLTRKHTTMSFPEIGRAMGNKNHSTVVMAVQRVEQMVAGDAAASWKTPHGARECLVRQLLCEVEEKLERRER